MYRYPDDGGVALECVGCSYVGLVFPGGDPLLLVDPPEGNPIPDRLVTGAGGASLSEDRWLEGVRSTGLDPIGYVIAGKEYAGDPEAAMHWISFEDWLADKGARRPGGRGGKHHDL